MIAGWLLFVRKGTNTLKHFAQWQTLSNTFTHKARSMRLASGVAVLTLTLAFALAACGTSTTSANATNTPGSSGSGTSVSIFSFGFNPSTLNVKVGQTVTWTNTASIEHTTTSDTTSAVQWDSSGLAQNATFQFTFTKAGTFTYHCNFHPNMHGTIVVTS